MHTLWLLSMGFIVNFDMLQRYLCLLGFWYISNRSAIFFSLGFTLFSLCKNGTFGSPQFAFIRLLLRNKSKTMMLSLKSSILLLQKEQNAVSSLLSNFWCEVNNESKTYGNETATANWWCKVIWIIKNYYWIHSTIFLLEA